MSKPKFKNEKRKLSGFKLQIVFSYLILNCGNA